MKTTFLLLIGLLLAISISGCIDSSIIGSPLVGVWEAKVIGFTQTLRFETNGTGVLITTLGQKAFEYQILDSTTLRIKYEGEENWDEKTYELISNDTLQLEGLIWVRKGSA